MDAEADALGRAAGKESLVEESAMPHIKKYDTFRSRAIGGIQDIHLKTVSRTEESLRVRSSARKRSTR